MANNELYHQCTNFSKNDTYIKLYIVQNLFYFTIFQIFQNLLFKKSFDIISGLFRPQFWISECLDACQRWYYNAKFWQW